jgi:uncharacterized protein YndB with AHSA1/START domain
MIRMHFELDPTLDLVLERTADVPPSFVWDAWTKPELLKRWFCPAPWQTVDAEIDLRPGGIFRTVMRSPEGQEFPNVGCFLEVVEGSRLVWTGALGPGYRPLLHGPDVPFVMTAIVTIEPTPGGGTKYTATALHADPSGRGKHEAMGFHFGWNAAFDQLVAMAPKG